MSGPEIVQVVPPGHLDWHGPLVALTPALLAIAAGIAAWLSPYGRWLIAFLGVVAAWLLLAVALIPGGAAASYQHPVADGWLALDRMAVLAALVTACVLAVVGRKLPPWWWAVGVALGLSLPLVVVARISGG